MHRRAHTHTHAHAHTHTQRYSHMDSTCPPACPGCLLACLPAGVHHFARPAMGQKQTSPYGKTSTHTQAWTHASMHACMHTWMHTNIHMQAHANTNTDRHMQAHTYRHTQAHTHPCTRTSKPCHARRNTHRTLPAPMQNELVGTRVRAFPGMPANND